MAAVAEIGGRFESKKEGARPCTPKAAQVRAGANSNRCARPPEDRSRS